MSHDPAAITARIRSTAELLADIATENQATLEQIPIAEIEPQTWLEYREIITTCSQLSTRARATANALCTPRESERQAA